MALPQTVLERLERETPRTPGWSGQLLMFSGTVFFLSILIWVGLVYGYKPYLFSQLKKAQTQIQAFGQQVPVEEQAKIANFYSQLTNLKNLLGGHVLVSQLFPWLEKNTEVNVYFEKFGLNTKTGEVLLGGVAKTMDDVNQQLAIFSSRQEVKKLSVTTVSFEGGAWRFDVKLSLNDGYFSQSRGNQNGDSLK